MSSFALLAYGLAFRDVDPDRACEAFRRGLTIAQDSGIRTIETNLAACLAYSKRTPGHSFAALEYFAVAIRNYYHVRQHRPTCVPRWPPSPLLLDRLGRYEPAATIAGFAYDPLTAVVGSRGRRSRSPIYARSSATRPTNRLPARVRR